MLVIAARYAVLVVASMLFAAVAVMLAPLLPLAARSMLGPVNNGLTQGIEPRLPGWLAWFMTPDNSLLGDARFKAEHGSNYWAMAQWLWRNPAYGFDATVLDADLPIGTTFEVAGDPMARDGINGREGWFRITATTPDGKKYFHQLSVKRISTARCWRPEFGWDLRRFVDVDAPALPAKAPFKFSPRLGPFG